MEHYIGKKGYTIPKALLTDVELIKIRKELFKIPLVSGERKKDEGFSIYRENEQKIYLPRFYAIEKWGMPKRNEIPMGETIEAVFSEKVKLYEHQKAAVEAYKKEVEKSPECAGGILELDCGMGKTVIALKIISELRLKTIIIVHKEFLMEQWKERIKEYLPGAKVGVIQGPKMEIEGNDIVIGMMQTLYNRQYESTVFDSFGLTIIDEVHRICSREFSRTLNNVMTRKIVGISATVDRKDSLSEVIYAYIGGIKYKGSRKQEEKKIEVYVYKYESMDEEVRKVEVNGYTGKVNYSSMMTKVVKEEARVRYVEEVIRKTLTEEEGERVIIMSEYRCLLERMYESIKKYEESVGFYVGGMKKEELEESSQQRVLLCTYGMASEGLDIKGIRRMCLLTPRTEVRQVVGRIQRSEGEGKIIEIVDENEVMLNQWRKRRKYYKSEGFKIKEK